MTCTKCTNGIITGDEGTSSFCRVCRPEEHSQAIKLETIALIVQSWIDWTFDQRAKDHLPTFDETAVMSVPEWPSIAQLQAWVKVLNRAALKDNG